MKKTIEIPEGYEARIEGNKVILGPKESEDERIRKEIITYLSTIDDKDLVPYDSWIAWFDKQGEQNLDNSAKTCKDEQNPAWSEEDEKTTQRIVDTIMKYAISPHSIINGDKPNLEYAKEFESWLKSLKFRIQPQWKPSDEQMTALSIIKDSGNSHEHEVLDSLYYDLKKLIG